MKFLGEVNRAAFRAAMDHGASLEEAYQAGAEAVKAEVIEHIKQGLDELTIETFENDHAEAVSAYPCVDVIDILNSELQPELMEVTPAQLDKMKRVEADKAVCTKNDSQNPCNGRCGSCKR